MNSSKNFKMLVFSVYLIILSLLTFVVSFPFVLIRYAADFLILAITWPLKDALKNADPSFNIQI